MLSPPLLQLTVQVFFNWISRRHQLLWRFVCVMQFVAWCSSSTCRWCSLQTAACCRRRTDRLYRIGRRLKVRMRLEAALSVLASPLMSHLWTAGGCQKCGSFKSSCSIQLSRSRQHVRSYNALMQLCEELAPVLRYNALVRPWTDEADSFAFPRVSCDWRMSSLPGSSAVRRKTLKLLTLQDCPS